MQPNLASNPQLLGLTPGVRAQAEIIQSSRAKLDLTYFSAVRVVAELDGTDYVVRPRKVRGFSYGLRDDMMGAGFPNTYQAEACDTNLATKGQTNNGADVLVRGFSIQKIAGSPMLLKQCARDMSVKLDIGSSDGAGWLLGPLAVMPGGAGLFGSEFDPEFPTNPVSNLSLGNPYGTNLRSFGLEPIRWAPVGNKDSADTIIGVTFEPCREIRFEAEVETPAEELFVDLMVTLYTSQYQPRGSNV